MNIYLDWLTLIPIGIFMALVGIPVLLLFSYLGEIIYRGIAHKNIDKPYLFEKITHLL